MDKYLYKKILVGIRLKFFAEGTVPITDAKQPLQVLSLKHKKGKYVKPHQHLPRQRKTGKLSECLIVRKGEVEIGLYGPDKKYFDNVILKAGELFLLMNGAWSVRVLKDAEIFEIKNGPFLKDEAEL